MSTCQLARAKLAQYVAGLDAQWGEKIAGIGKAGKLANPVTPMKNTFGNAGSLGIWGLATQPVEVALDYFVALGQAAKATVQDRAPMSPALYRTKALAVDARGLKEARRGWKKGVAEFQRMMRTGIDPDMVEGKLDAYRVTYDSPVLQTFYDKVFGLISGSDRPFFEAGFRMSLYSRAKVTALREGLSGDARSARVAELLRRPTDEMAIGAAMDAERLTFRNQGPVGHAIGRMKASMREYGKKEGDARKQTLGQAAFLATEATVPFVSTPLAVAGTMIDYSPLGLLKTAAMQLPEATRGRASLIEGVSRAGIGTAAGVGLGWALAEKGILTGSAPTGASERAQWELEGRKENSIRIGDRWYSLGAAAPATLMPLWGANLYDQAQAQGKEGMLDAVTDGEVLTSTVAAQMKSLTEQAFLSGLKDLLDALTAPDKRGARFAASLVNSLNPLASMTGRVARAADPYAREQDSFVKDVAADLPGVSRMVPAKLDAFGQPIKKEEGAVRNALHALFDPTSSRRARDDALLSEMRRLEVYVGRPGRTVRVIGKPTRRTAEEYRRHMETIGPKTRTALEELLASEWYQTASDEDRAKEIKKEINDIRDEANDEFKEQKADSISAEAIRRVGRNR